MVIRKKHWPFESKSAPDPILNPELVFDPERDGLKVGPQASRTVVQVGIQETLKLNERLFVEDYVVDVSNTAFADPAAGFDGLRWERTVMLDSAETFLLDGGDN
jgi:hypothetical protein